MAAVFSSRISHLSKPNSRSYHKILTRCFFPKFPTCLPNSLPVRDFYHAHHLNAKKPQAGGGSSNSTPKASSRRMPASRGAHGVYKSLAETLSSRSSPTLLYQAPSPTVYIAACYSFGAFCLVYAGSVFYSQYLHPMDGTPGWLPVMMGGVSVFMTFVGVRSFLGVYRLVRSITALPTTNGALLLKIDNAAMFPGLRPRAVTVPYADVSLSSQLLEPAVKLSPAELTENHRRQAQMREIERSKIMTLPFRQASYWTWRGFQVLKRAVFKEGFIYLKIKCKSGVWKVDKAPAWAAEDGKVLDRLVKRGFL